MQLAVPQKIMLAGEYSVLRPGGHALAVAVEPGFAVSAAPAHGVHLSLPDLGLDYSIAGLPDRDEGVPHRALLFPLRSLELLQESYGDHVTGVKLEFRRQEGGLGISGASSALAVGCVRGAAGAAGLELKPEEIFQIAAAAHARAQSGGSGYDVAACAYGGMVLFRPPSRVSSAPTAGDLHLVVADSGRSSDTAALVRRFGAALSKTAFRRAHDHHQTASSRLCAGLWEGASEASVRDLVEEANLSLERLDRTGGIGVFTPEMQELLHIAGGVKTPARISGAGGGDLVVGLTFHEEAAAELASAWRGAGYATKSFTPALVAIG